MNADLVISSIQPSLHLPGCIRFCCLLSHPIMPNLNVNVCIMLQKWMRRTASEGGWNVWMRCPTLRNSLWISKTSKAWTVFVKFILWTLNLKTESASLDSCHGLRLSRVCVQTLPWAAQPGEQQADRGGGRSGSRISGASGSAAGEHAGPHQGGR